ncbi:hypothetical protein JCM14469_22700 [Desulfatiferula olefinivorans]
MTTPRPTVRLTVMLMVFTVCGCTGGPGPSGSPASPAESLLPMTRAGIRGHQMLYDEGWFVVTSSRDALAYARENAFRRSAESLRMIAGDVKRHSLDYAEKTADDGKAALSRSVGLLEGGTVISGALLSGALDLAGEEVDFAADRFQAACLHFIRGNLSVIRRSSEEYLRLTALPGHYFDTLSEDFSNIRQLADRANRVVAETVALSWDDAFDEAARAFHAEYEQSGRRGNSLTALGDILSGYLKAFYAGLAKPGAKSIVEYGAKGAGCGIFLPAAAVTVISGRTIEATGMALYHTSRTGYHVIAPTVESGLLAGLALTSAAAAPVTLAGGAGLSAVNQVAFTAASPVWSAGKIAADTAVNTGRYVARVSVDLGRGTSEVLIHQASSAVVLGYNALTAVPVHLFLGTYDAVVLLCLDGPNLVLVLARGRATGDDGPSAYSLGALPAGTVLDLDTLRQDPSIDVQVISDDPDIIGGVLERLPDDLRETR